VENIKEHIICKTIATLLIVSLLLPSAVKFTHIFENHEHEVCETPQKSHYHSFDLDCELYKFNIKPQIPFVAKNYDLVDVSINSTLIKSQYQSISKFQRLSFSLRGPPGLV